MQMQQEHHTTTEVGEGAEEITEAEVGEEMETTSHTTTQKTAVEDSYSFATVAMAATM